MKKPIKLIFYLGAMGIIASVAFWGVTQTYSKKDIPQSNNDLPVDISLDPNNKPLLIDVSDDEYKNIEELINQFESLKYLKKFTDAFNLITPPVNKEEQGWFDHLLGNDVISKNDGEPFPRFTFKANYHLLVGYNIKKVSKENDTYFVNVDELRVIRVSEEEEGETKDQDDLQNLTFELVDNNGNLQISRYYHSKPRSLVNLKYEGFVAF